MASGFYNSYFFLQGEGAFNLSTATLKLALVTSSYTYDRDTHEFFDDITSEVSGTGYTAGGATLTTVTWTKDNTNDKSVLDADDVSWANSTITARGGVLYVFTGTAATSELLLYLDFVTDKTTANTEFKVTWNASGILDISEV